MTATTRSRPAPRVDPYSDPANLKRLRLSPEVAWYLKSRKIPLPTCVPKVKSPEPCEVMRRGAGGPKFDPERVDKVLKAFHLLRHTKGKWAGKPLDPDPWQIAYVIAPVFGWVRFDKEADRYVRIIRNVFVDIPRKNGKSTLCGGIGVYLTAADGEPGAEVVAAATTTRQAGFVFNPIKQLVNNSPALKGNLLARATRIVHPLTGSYFEVISSAADAQHGANLHGGVIDELHVHRTPDLVDVIETGTGSRDQPLILKITTADDGRPETIYARNRARIERLEKRIGVPAPEYYGVVWAADDEDDPFDEATWRKANPGLGVSPTLSFLRQEAQNAKDSPADLAKFRRLHLGIRTKQATKYVELAAWDRNASIVEESKLAGSIAYGGLDLASTSDLSALSWLFPYSDGTFDVIWRIWTPEDNLVALDRRTANSASAWVKNGFLIATPGNVMDYDYIYEQILKDVKAFDVQFMGYDAWNSSQLINKLVEEEVPVVPMRQGYATLSAPTKEFQRLVMQGARDGAEPVLRHGGHPVMRWMVDNLAVSEDPAGNVKPDKKTSGEKIDGVAALVNAIEQFLRDNDERDSVYNEEGSDPLVIGGW